MELNFVHAQNKIKESKKEELEKGFNLHSAMGASFTSILIFKSYVAQ